MQKHVKPYFSLYAHSDPIYAQSEPIYAPSEPIYAPSEPIYAPSEPIMSQVNPVMPQVSPLYAPSEPQQFMPQVSSNLCLKWAPRLGKLRGCINMEQSMGEWWDILTYHFFHMEIIVVEAPCWIPYK